MDQNTIAIIWDFDKTLVNGYMQEPIFKKYEINSSKFWNEVNTLTKRYAAQNIRVNPDTIYLNHMITCANQGIFKNLNNKLLYDLGAELNFYPGIPKIFSDLKSIINSNHNYQKFGIHVEHYIVSTGLTEMIKGSLINEYVDGIWGCEFIENPIRSNLDIKIDQDETEKNTIIQQSGYIIDNTSKTRAIFEINKGSNKFEYIDVNSKIMDKDRRVPFENMIYIADGPSDVPVFSILKQYGGKTFAIYPKSDLEAFKQVDALRKDGRIDMYAEADYSKDTMTYLWLLEHTKEIADSIYSKLLKEVEASASKPPKHISTITQ